MENVAKEFNNCLIQLDFASKRINLHGHKPDVVNAKLKLSSMISILMNAMFSQSKNIQWQYQNSGKDWIDFSYLLNCYIEEGYLANKDGSVRVAEL